MRLRSNLCAPQRIPSMQAWLGHITQPAKHKPGYRNGNFGPGPERLVQKKAAAIPPITMPAPTLFQNEAANLTRALRCKPLPK